MNDPAVILWWGDDLRVLHGGSLTRRRLGRREAPLRALLEEAGRAQALRFLYLPDSLGTREVDDPCDTRFWGRSRLARRLADKVPALASRSTIWAAAAEEGSFSSTLFLEVRSPLPALAESLIRAGRRVEGAWPLPLLLGESPTPHLGRGSLSVAFIGGRALVCWTSASGERGVQTYSGEGASSDAVAAVHAALARFEEGEAPPGWCVTEEGAGAEAIRQAGEQIGLTALSWEDLLARVPLSDPSEVSNLLPTSSWWTRKAVRTAAAVLILSLSVAAAGTHAWSTKTRREASEREAAGVELQRQQHEAEQYQGALRQEKIAELSREWERLDPGIQPHSEFLKALSRSGSAQSHLDSVDIDGSNFVVTGMRDDGASGVPDDLAKSLAASGAPWTLAGQGPPQTGPRFTVAGRFVRSPAQPAFDPGAKDLLQEWTRRVGDLKAKLPTEAQFGEMKARWSSRWSVSAEPSPSANLRSFHLAYSNPKMADWPDLLRSIEEFCRSPGLSIDRLALAAMPDDSGNFREAELRLTVRLR